MHVYVYLHVHARVRAYEAVCWRENVHMYVYAHARLYADEYVVHKGVYASGRDSAKADLGH